MFKMMLNDWPGWLFIFLSFFIVYKFWKTKKDKKLTLAIGFMLLLHHFIAIINAYFYTFPGAEPDPVNFHGLAIEWAVGGKLLLSFGTNFFAQLLGIFYRIFGPSQLLGEELSILVFLLSCFVLIKIVELLNISKYTVPLLLIYGLLPTNLIFCSKTLREPYQILFFMLSIYWGLRFHLKPAKVTMIFCVLSVLIMGLFHKALIFYALFLVPVLFLWFPKQISGSLNNRRCLLNRRWILVGLVLIIVVGIFTVGNLDIVKGLEVTMNFFSGNGLKYAEEYRAKLIFENAPDARANYGIMLDTFSAISLIKSTLLMFVYYLFAPFPWQVTNWLDVYGVTESLLRLLLIAFSIISWYRAEGLQRRIWGLLLVIYFSMTLLWSIGTVNYGTSIRHHLLTNWIIIILGGPGLVEFIIRKFRRIFSFTI